MSIILCSQPHHQIHHCMLINEIISSGKKHNSKQGILHDTHNWFIRLRAHNLIRNGHYFFNLSHTFKALWNKHVHFITVEISIVRCSYTKVQSKCREWQDSYSVPHCRHFMKRGLPIKNNIIA